jgi:hypothetical protein
MLHRDDLRAGLEKLVNLLDGWRLSADIQGYNWSTSRPKVALD